MAALVTIGFMVLMMLIAFLTVIYKLDLIIKNQHTINLKIEVLGEVVSAIAEKNGINIDEL